MPFNDPKFIIGTADQLDQAPMGALVILEISRAEIEAQNIASALERLHALCDTAETVMRHRERLLLSFAGFDGDSRELPEIPQVRTFVQRLAHEWPHWMWFLNREPGHIALFMTHLCRVRIHRRGGAFGTEFLDYDELNQHFADLLERGLALFEAFDVPANLVEESATSAAHALLG